MTDLSVFLVPGFISLKNKKDLRPGLNYLFLTLDFTIRHGMVYDGGCYESSLIGYHLDEEAYAVNETKPLDNVFAYREAPFSSTTYVFLACMDRTHLFFTAIELKQRLTADRLNPSLIALLQALTP